MKPARRIHLSLIGGLVLTASGVVLMLAALKTGSMPAECQYAAGIALTLAGCCLTVRDPSSSGTAGSGTSAKNKP